jgi:hypothetical protein
MIFGGLEFVAAKYVGAKLLAAHGAHAIAAKAAFAAHHPLSAPAPHAAHQSLNLIMKNPHIPAALKVAVAQSLQQQLPGATGAVAASVGTGSALRSVAKLAELAAMPVAAPLVRKTDAYLQLTDALTALIDEVKNGKDLRKLLSGRFEDWEGAILASIRRENP